MNYRPYTNTIPPVIKNLIILNVLFLLATWAFSSAGTDLVELLGMHYPESEKFRFYQIITYMFMHDPKSIGHIFFNMFALWMFGRVLESVWGPRRFLIYYFVTGIGALALHMLVNYIEISSVKSAIEAFNNTPAPDVFEKFVNKHLPNPSDQLRDFIQQWYSEPGNIAYMKESGELMNQILTLKIDIPTVGASGAVFGILLAFGMLFPNTQLMLLFPPIPIKAKYFVFGYGLIELFLGFMQPGSNVAHFAHLGGMIFGYFMIKYWNKSSRNFY
jgi:membrane associated rhomboid family serine protease